MSKHRARRRYRLRARRRKADAILDQAERLLGRGDDESWDEWMRRETEAILVMKCVRDLREMTERNWRLFAARPR
jgi:hypothetical protein